MNYKAYNGYGGFNNTGDEYEILNTHTPVPWCNVLTNERFGTLVSTYGTVYSFYKNAGEFKLTQAPECEKEIILDKFYYKDYENVEVSEDSNVFFGNVAAISVDVISEISETFQAYSTS